MATNLVLLVGWVKLTVLDISLYLEGFILGRLSIKRRVG